MGHFSTFQWLTKNPEIIILWFYLGAQRSSYQQRNKSAKQKVGEKKCRVRYLTTPELSIAFEESEVV